ncbi:MFS transporter [Kitasatospora viridis]
MLGTVCLVQLVVVLDNTVLNVALPELGRALGAGTPALQWITTAYSLAQAGLLLTAGAAADRYGRRRMLLAGLLVFGAGSLAAALAGGTGQLVAARAVMGVGGALLTTATLAVVMQVFDGAERDRAIAVWAMVSALGFAAGPPIGGLLLAHFWWGAVFLANLPVVLLGLLAARRLVPESHGRRDGRPDLVGAVLSTVGMVSVVRAITAGPDLPTVAVAVAALTGFLCWERRTAQPMLDLAFFRDRRFTGAVSGVLLITAGSTGALFLLTQQLQLVHGLTPLAAGLRMAPFALTVVLLHLTGVSTRLIARLGTAGAIALGMALLAAGLAVTVTGALPVGLLLMGTGCALANPALVAAVLGAIPPEKAGAGAGIDGATAELGASLGVAVLGAVLDARFTALAPAGVPADSPYTALGAGRPDLVHAFGEAARTAQLLGAATVLAGGLLAALLLRRADRAPLTSRRNNPHAAQRP